MSAATPCRLGNKQRPRPLALALGEQDECVAVAIADQLATSANGPEAAQRLDRLADLALARSGAERHLARVLRRAVALYRLTPSLDPQRRNSR